jgi:hypothetical protein
MTRRSDVAAGWRKSARSSPGECVEVLIGRESVQLRDSKDREGPVLRFSHAEWQAFLGGVGDGEFDLPSVES